MRRNLILLVIAGLALGDAPPARGSLAVLDQFDPSNTAGLCGAAFDPTQSRLWLHGCFGTGIDSYSPVGAFLSSLSRPGEAANDVDLEVAPEALSFHGSQVPAGTLFLVNGETGVAEIHAIHPASGVALGTLVTAFGDAHVVGGAYHAGRNKFASARSSMASRPRALWNGPGTRGTTAGGSFPPVPTGSRCAPTAAWCSADR